MNTPSEQPSSYPSPVNTHPEPLPRCSWCGGVASSDPCVSCRPTDAADAESGRTLFYFAVALALLVIAGVAWCIV